MLSTYALTMNQITKLPVNHTMIHIAHQQQGKEHANETLKQTTNSPVW